MRYLALGDSYTIGEGVAEHERWPNQLVGLLRNQGLAVGDPMLIAQTAWTTDELSDAIDAERLRDKFDFVTLLVGVNDQYRSRPVSAFTDGFAPLLRRAKGFASRRASRVIVLSIPDWGATPFGQGRDRARIARDIDAYNARAHELTTATGSHWVNITGATRAMQDTPRLAAPDGLHPSGTMYEEWARLVLPVVLTALARRVRAS